MVPSGLLGESLKLYMNEVKSCDFGGPKGAEAFTCADFDESGDYLAAGDKSGRIYVFNGSSQNSVYNLFCAFTSHEPEFDYLKSLEIEEKINSICWLPTVNNSLQLLSTNDKVIKLWRMSEQSPFAYNFNFRPDEKETGNAEIEMLSKGSGDASTNQIDNGTDNNDAINKTTSCVSLRIPRYKKRKNFTIEVRPRKVYANAHIYHINAISVNSDQETFLSADDLRINLWHLNVPDQSFTIVDIKPENMEELNEVITCSRFHPELCNMFGYSSSRGVIRLCDMRVGALCDNHVLLLDDPSLAQNRGFFCDIVSSLSDFRFDHSGNYILARDYLNLKAWDLRKGDSPCEIYSVHEPLRSQLCMLYESDAIFDKFLCSWSEDDRYVFTGSYGNVLRVFDRHQGTDWAYDLGESSVHPTAATATTPVSLFSNSPNYNLRPRLQPKRFIAPESEVASRFQLQTVHLANASALDALSSPTSSFSSATPTTAATNKNELNVSISPVVAGSKRRKQTLLPAPQHYDNEEEEDEEEDDSREDLDDDSDEFEAVGGEDSVDGICHDSLKVNGRSPMASAAARSMLTGLREMDYRRRFLLVAWHPQRPLLVAINGKEMFFVCGKEVPLTAGSPPCLEDEEERTEEYNNPDGTAVSSYPVLSSPLDVKAAKRRRRRQGEPAVPLMPSLTTSSSDSSTSEGQADDSTTVSAGKRSSMSEDTGLEGETRTVTEAGLQAESQAAGLTVDMEFE